MTPLTFCLFNIIFTFHSLTSSTSTGFTSSFFCPPTYSLYHTTWLTFTTRWILIDVGSCNLTALVDTTSSIIYGPTYWFTSFLTSHSWNTKSFTLNITLSPTFYTLAFFLPLFIYLFISFCAFINAIPVSFSSFLQIPLLFPSFFFPQIHTHFQLSSIIFHEWKHFGCWMCLVVYHKLC